MWAFSSPAIEVAIDRVNSENMLPFGYKLTYEIGETYGMESESIGRTAEFWRRSNGTSRKVSAIIGPQETCKHEARMAASFNMPMISHYCSQREPSDKGLYQTFVRTKPSDHLVFKSVTCLLLKWVLKVTNYLLKIPSDLCLYILDLNGIKLL